MDSVEENIGRKGLRLVFFFFAPLPMALRAQTTCRLTATAGTGPGRFFLCGQTQVEMRIVVVDYSTQRRKATVVVEAAFVQSPLSYDPTRREVQFAKEG
jgi:hypothetical protein